MVKIKNLEIKESSIPLKKVELNENSSATLKRKKNTQIKGQSKKNLYTEGLSTIELIMNRQFDEPKIKKKVFKVNKIIEEVSREDIKNNVEDQANILIEKDDFSKFTENIKNDTSNLYSEDVLDIRSIVKSKINETKFNFISFKEKRLELSIIFLILVIATLLMYIFSVDNQGDNKNSNVTSIEKVKKLAIIPENEIPSTYKILGNADVLKNPLFSKAKVDDIVFLFEKNKQILIFREVENKIVDILQIK